MSETIKQQVFTEYPVFHIDWKKYSVDDAESLLQFCLAEYPSKYFRCDWWQIKKNIRLEIPRGCKTDKFASAVAQMMIEAMMSCQIQLKKRNWYIRFVPKLIDENTGDGVEYALADTTDLKLANGKTIYVIRVSMSELNLDDGDSLIANVAFRILHEIFEKNYWETGNNKSEKERSIPTDLHYDQAEHEDYANQRAFEVIKKHFPNSHHTQKDSE